MLSVSRQFQRRLDIDYGNPSPPQEQVWESMPGDEIFCANPDESEDPEGLPARVRQAMEGKDFALPTAADILRAKVRNDPYEKLPLNLLHLFASFLQPQELVNASKASWYVHTAFHSSQAFWKDRIRRDLPWFYELQGLLNGTGVQSGPALNFKGVFLWALEMTTPKLNMRGPFMWLANRRRIWGVCERISALYNPGGKEGGTAADYVRAVIRKDAWCAQCPIVSAPVPSETEKIEVYWVQSWREVYKQKNLLMTSWDKDGSLVGVSIAEGARITFGPIADERNEMMSTRQYAEIGTEDWITGFVLHSPGLDLSQMRRPIVDAEEGQAKAIGTATSIKGITVRFIGLEAR
jgi:hypothetical protein